MTSAPTRIHLTRRFGRQLGVLCVAAIASALGACDPTPVQQSPRVDGTLLGKLLGDYTAIIGGLNDERRIGTAHFWPVLDRTAIAEELTLGDRAVIRIYRLGKTPNTVTVWSFETGLEEPTVMGGSIDGDVLLLATADALHKGKVTLGARGFSREEYSCASLVGMTRYERK